MYEVAQEPLILYDPGDPGSSYFQFINRVCRDAGVTPKVEMNLDSVEAAKNMVLLGLGISFLPRSGVRRELASGSLALIDLAEVPPVLLPTYVLLRRGQQLVNVPGVVAVRPVERRVGHVAGLLERLRVVLGVGIHPPLGILRRTVLATPPVLVELALDLVHKAHAQDHGKAGLRKQAGLCDQGDRTSHLWHRVPSWFGLGRGGLLTGTW